MGSIFGPVLRFLGGLLSACYSLTGDYALAIALFTVVIMLVFTPLTMKSTRSMMSMQQIQPEMKALQAKHRDDRQTLNTEMMALYQSHGVNPLGGCLPMLVQIPVFFMLFSLLRGLTRLNEARTEFNPNYLSEDSELFKDLSRAGMEMVSFGVDLAQQANEVVSDDLVASIPYVLMVVVTGLTSWLQQRQMAARRTPGVEIPQQQQMLMKILPWTLPVFAFFMPAGLVVYFIVSNLWRVGQQSYISRRIVTRAVSKPSDVVIEGEVVEPSDEKPARRPKPSGKTKPGQKPKPVNKPKSGSSDRGSSSDKQKSSSRPRPRPRQRPARANENIRSGSSTSGPKRSRKSRNRGKDATPRRPKPTSRTAGHGPAAKRKKKR